MAVAGKVNTSLLPGKVAFYFMTSAGLWTYPFLILFLKDLGLSTTECSVIYGSLPIVSGFFRVIVGAVADKLQKYKEMTLLFTLLSATLHSCFLLVPKVERENQLQDRIENNTALFQCLTTGTDSVKCIPLNATYFNMETFVDVCPLNLTTELQSQQNCSNFQKELTLPFKHLDGEPHICKVECDRIPSDGETPRFGKTFWIAFGLYFVTFNLLNCIWVFLYAMNYAVLGEARNMFGKQRMWGPVGAIVTSIISAIAMNKYGSSVVNDITYTPCFIGLAMCLAFTGVTSMFFKLPHMGKNPTIAKDLFLLLKQPQISLLFVVLFIMGCLYGAVDAFLLVFLRSLNASSWNMGACLLVQYVGEIPALYYSGKLFKKIGHVRCLYIVLFVYCIKYLGTSLIPSPWWELPFSAMKSVVFSIGFTAVSVYTCLITPPSTHATLQATVQTIHFGFGKGVGILALGPAMEAFGARWGFRMGSIIALVTFVFYIIAQQFVPPVKFVTQEKPEESEPELHI